MTHETLHAPVARPHRATRVDPALWATLRNLEQWIRRGKQLSYDPYDLWGTRYGLWARAIYYRSRWLGTPLVCPLVAVDLFAPSVRTLIVTPMRSAAALAHIILAWLHCYRVTQELHYLTDAETLAQDLLALSIPGYAGHCWGYPFDWQNTRGLWKRQTPLMTVTPYGYEAFCALYDITRREPYARIAASSVQFALQDLHETAITKDMAACSYSPLDHSLVVNVNAYRAWMLLDAAARGFGDGRCEEAARRNLAFILQAQQSDGSWLYALGDAREAFIDNFHTCFVLNNLIKLNRHVHDARIQDAIRRGYHFYRTALLDAHGQPRPFARAQRLQLVKRELYDVAEGILLGVLLRDDAPEAYERARAWAAQVGREDQLADGHVVTKVLCNGWRVTFPYLRWPQAQMVHALAALAASQRCDDTSP